MRVGVGWGVRESSSQPVKRFLIEKKAWQGLATGQQGQVGQVGQFLGQVL